MRVLFTIYPNSLAHLYPVVPLAWALQSAGHEVRIATHVSSAELIVRTGLTPVGLGDPEQPPVRLTDDCSPPRSPEDVDRYARVLGLTPEQREHWIVFYQYLMQPVSDYVRLDRSEASDLVDFASTWKPDLIFWDPTHPAGAVAARVSGAAHARFLIGHDMFGWCLDRLAERRDDLRAAGLDENPLASLIRPLAEHYGLEVDRELLYGQWSVETMLDGLRLPTSTKKLSMRHVPYVDPQLFPEWLHESPENKRCECCGRLGRRRIAMSLGESTRRFINGDWDRTPRILQALEGLEDLEVVATLDQAQLHDVKKVPHNVRPIDWVPLPQLMPTCSALIHHGGIGTYSAAVAAKVPQLVCDLADESLLMRLVEDDPNVMKAGTYRLGWEFGVREEGEASAPTAHWELPAKKVEATPVSEFMLSKGSGARLDHRAQSIEEMRELIWHVATDPSYHANAAALYDDWMAMPGPGDVVPDLEKLTVQNRRR
ncbi:UDP:flavonoid glycosyltransferase YjiC, YdhE family [Actinopolyspora mzabensis]|uniref:UDP:flavonoid glycosyltransferase YjiC, YdhE family n=1 Tax=Actinopolyspora mzabensis TaxID=995066 RepID=A0A1G8Y7M7_ACTMZ|nr:nucleotide disphospho-sugar-binding domain-containing protein [Actinopolyspora mzabensis]SDJ98205.1 UDP:flavonoid glycosyltransferase YjiC, YdhE family [Actinopolyspora mzabensis]